MPLFNSRKPPSNLPPPVGYNTCFQTTEERRKRTSVTNFFHAPSINLKRKYEEDQNPQHNHQEHEIKRKKTAAAAAAAAAANVKNHMGTMSRLFQRIAVTINKSTRSATPRQDPQPEFVDAFQTIQLPNIEWTDGSLNFASTQIPQPQSRASPVSPIQEKPKLKLQPQPSPQPVLLHHLAQPQPQPQLQPVLLQHLADPEEDSVFCINASEFMEFPVPPLLKTATIPSTRRIRQDSCPPKFNSLIIIEEEETSDDDDDSMPSTPFNDPISFDGSNSSNKLEMLGLA